MTERNLLVIILLFVSASFAGAQTMPETKKITIKYIDRGFAISDLTNKEWDRSPAVVVDTYWNGAAAPAGRRFVARVLWSDEHLYIRFEARQEEPLIISKKPNRKSKTMNLWDRDVGEIFVAPDRANPRKYFEFEVAPTGEWIDVALDSTGGERVSDWDYASGMESAAKIETDIVTMALKVPWSAFGRKPRAGDVWLGNLFRCVGKDPNRGYLAWSPTLTKTPNFHVPERFGEFVFVN